MSSKSDGPRSSKRPRVDEETQERPPIPQRDEDVWLSDGNIVVIAQDTVAFRVHKSILSLRSEIFSDLFSLPDTSRAAVTEETMDGLPVVRVSDSPDDIRRLFLVLCCGKNYYYNRDVLVPVPFAILASLIRMAHKYAIQDVLDDALSRLKRFYTTDLSVWKNPAKRACYVTATDADAPEAVALARLTNTLLLLPTALLMCVWLAANFSDPPSNDDAPPGSDPESPVSVLSVADQMCLVDAAGDLTQACATRMLHLLAAVPCSSCTSRQVCTAAKEGPLDTLRRSPRRVYVRLPYVTPQRALTPIAREMWGEDGWMRFCENCQDALTRMDGRAIKALWLSLPSVFGLADVIDKVMWQGGSDAGVSQ